jgi:uncharacterized integral membrane protein
MNRTKIIVLAAAVIIVLILVLQNTTQVQTRILFATITMPRAVLLVITFALGYVAGLLTPLVLKRKTEQKEA